MTITALSDAELLEQARGGDEAAFTELYVRHQAAAHRLASTYRRMGDPDDLVNGAFERVLGALRRGSGPTESFRAYLFVTLRRLAAEQGEKPADQPIDEVPEPVSDEADSPELAGADKELITKAFESLPDRWQAVLWHTAVEGRKPRELGAVLGVSANAAAAMAYRAREKLRQAYLQAHLLASPAPEHEPYRSQLGAYVRDGLSARDKAAVDRHLAGCEACRALVEELDDVNRVLVRSVAPLFLLAGGAPLAIVGVGAGAAGGTAAASSAGGVVDRGARKLRHLAPTIGSVIAIAALVAGVAGLGGLVSRNSGGPVDNADDAADIGPTGAGGAGGGAGSGGGSGSDSDLFGAPDGALGPSAAGAGADAGLGPADSGPTPFLTPAATPPTTAPTTPPANPPTDAPTPPSNPPPSKPTPPSNPPPDPPPPALAFGASAWTPTAVGRGDLAVTIGEQGASAARLVLSAAAATPEPLRLEVTLTAGARAFPGAPLDSGCTATGSTISCSLEQPPKGGSAQFTFPLQVDGAGQTATLKLFRGTTVEATAAIALSPFEEGLDLTEPVWETSPVTGGPGRAPVGLLTVGAVNGGDDTMPAPTVTVAIEGDGAFVPPALFEQLSPEELLELAGVPPGLIKQLVDQITAPLPAGCSVVGWTPPTGEVSWDSVLQGGLPSTIRCELADLAPGATVTLGGLLAVVQPLYSDGVGTIEGATAQVTLALDGAAVAEPRTIELAAPPSQVG